MKRIILLMTLCLVGACSETPSAPKARSSAPLFAKAASGVDSRAQWFFHRLMSDGLTATRLYGDGRRLDGTAVINSTDDSEYDGEAQCSVRATINWYKSSPPPSGDAFFGPTGGTTSLCQNTPRTVSVDTSGGVIAVAWTTTIQQVMNLAIGQSRIQDDMWTPAEGIPNCARLRYSIADLGSGVKVTRVSGNTSRVAGTWTVESQGTHVAGCYNFTKGSTLTHTGPDFYLPLSVTIVEVLR